MANTLPQWLQEGATVYDSTTKRMGVVQMIGRVLRRDGERTHVWLRPIGGGQEWSTDADKLYDRDGTR